MSIPDDADKTIRDNLNQAEERGSDKAGDGGDASATHRDGERQTDNNA